MSDEQGLADICMSDATSAPEVQPLLDRVEGVMAEIDRAKRERSADGMRAARAHLAALHGVARLRRQAERQEQSA